MNIYILEYWDGHDVPEMLGVYSSKENAEAAARGCEFFVDYFTITEEQCDTGSVFARWYSDDNATIFHESMV